MEIKMETRDVCLTSTLSVLMHEPGVTESQKNSMAGLLLEAVENVSTLNASLSAEDVAMVIHAGVDRLISARQSNPQYEPDKITCRKGCAHCCSQIVSCSAIEAALLVQVARKKNMALDTAKLQRQSGRNDATWLEQTAEDRACIFLGADNLCQVYEDRPASCRKYFAISEPSLCDISANRGGDVQVWFDVYSEILTSAMFTAGQVGFLPDLLLAELRRRPSAVKT